MNEEMRTFGYLCPKCGKTVMAARSIFALEASNAEVACACGESALRVSYDGERYHLSIPCGVCGETHTAVCSSERKHLRELAILAEKEQPEEGAFTDSVIMYEILSELKEIAARPDGVTCACGSRRYGMEIRRAAVDLVCRECGAKLRLPAATDRDLDDLCCHMKLVIPGGRT